MTLKLVEKLHKDNNPSIETLYTKLMDVVIEHVDNNPAPITTAEIIGTLEFLKTRLMGVKLL